MEKYEVEIYVNICTIQKIDLKYFIIILEYEKYLQKYDVCITQ